MATIYGMNVNDFKNTVSLYARNALPVIMCIGSTKIMSDCYGPFVGYLLREKYRVNAFVYGTLCEPINALNLVSSLDFVKLNHPQSRIVCVDSFISDITDKDEIRFIPGPIKPGLASGKSLPPVGDVSIISSSAKTPNNAYCLGKISLLAEISAKIISDALLASEKRRA